MKKLELLAPAKDLETAKAAINAGADALYIGGPGFSARSQAHNSLEDISQCVEYAHTFSARVYITLNTLLFDEELKTVEKLIHELYRRGIDALIIQDMGILAMDLPPLPLFASTQCHITTPEKARFLEQLGFERIILERSLSLDEIRAIRQATTVALEAFVHGSICISYSGQCYLSYALGGRSGNRGECAQPCRLSYQLLDRYHNPLGHPRYWLSPKDLCLHDNLEDLIEAGITSFKIEGRLKDPTYVTNVVSAYREKLDALIAKKGYERASLGDISRSFTPHLSKSFNRGMTPYWLHGRKKQDHSVLSLFTQKSIGEYVGIVTFANHRFFLLDREHTLAPGDGICYFDKRKTLQGTRINTVKEGKIFPEVASFIRKGYHIYRNHDEVFTRSLSNHPPERTIPIALRVEEIPEGIRLYATDPTGISVSSEIPLSKKIFAENPSQAEETLRRQLSRLGNTPYRAASIEIQWKVPLFFPVGHLNQWRRDLIEKLHQTRLSHYQRCLSTHHLPETLSCPYLPPFLDYRLNVLNHKALEVYKHFGIHPSQKAAESGASLIEKPVMTTKTCLKLELGLCEKHPRYHDDPLEFPLTTRPLEPFYLSTQYTLLRLEFDCVNCEMQVILVSHKKR
ncbi:MAG: U32 family peptidase [Brevinematales bacterium]|nr:U32 family peptidase [Brevinematales bacterium]